MSMKIVSALGLLLACNLANAMEGVFDRSAEIDQYVAQLNGTATQAELITTSRAIYISGISDERLAKAITDRLLRDLPSLKSIGDGDQYGAWMVKALASTGDPSAKATITKVQNSTSVYRIKAECKEQVNEVDWQRRKNEVMASRRNYNEGDNMRVAQLLNLLQSDDFSHKQDAAYRMSWDRTLDPRLMAEMATQAQTYVDKGMSSGNKAELVVMSHYAKMLGYSNNPEYKPLLRKLLGAPHIVEKQARISLDRL